MENEIKIVGFISSANRDGNTAVLVREALKGAKEKGAIVTEILLKDYITEFCTGCLQCTAKGKCPLPDRFEELRKLVYGADGIIFGSPTYCSEYNTIMKNFFERLGPYTLFSSSLGGKYIAGISTSNGQAYKKTAKKLVGICKLGIFQRPYISGTFGTKTMFNGNEIKVSDNVDALNRGKLLGYKIVNDVKQHKSYPLQNLFMRLFIVVKLRKIFRNYILKNKDGKEKATYENLAARGLL